MVAVVVVESNLNLVDVDGTPMQICIVQYKSDFNLKQQENGLCEVSRQSYIVVEKRFSYRL
jgi:hypothetical protein